MMSNIKRIIPQSWWGGGRGTLLSLGRTRNLQGVEKKGHVHLLHFNSMDRFCLKLETKPKWRNKTENNSTSMLISVHLFKKIIPFYFKEGHQTASLLSFQHCLIAEGFLLGVKLVHKHQLSLRAKWDNEMY